MNNLKSKTAALYVKNSHNRKIGKNVDATYVSINSSCPTTCSLYKNGCYAENSYSGMINYELNKNSRKYKGKLRAAQDEAKVIDNSYTCVPNGKYLRLHVSGDSTTKKGTRLLNNAIKRWLNKGGALCWSYTHAWKNIHRKLWSNVSILASVSSVKEVCQARKQGYAPAIIVNEHPTNNVFVIPGSKTKWIPCPAQTGGKSGTKDITCISCKLCFNANRLYKNNYGIAFAAHGVRKEAVKRRLKVL